MVVITVAPVVAIITEKVVRDRVLDIKSRLWSF
jgi:hypothetical protein